MNQRGHSPFVRVRLPHAALVTAWSLIILSCSGCVRGAHGIHPGVPSEQELIGPKVTILPAGTPVHVRLLKTLNTHKVWSLRECAFSGHEQRESRRFYGDRAWDKRDRASLHHQPRFLETKGPNLSGSRFDIGRHWHSNSIGGDFERHG